MSLESAKAKLDAQPGDPATGYISKADHQDSYTELVDDTALTGATTAEALTISGTLNGRDPDNLVAGPASATDNALVRFDGTGGKTVQNSGLIVDDSNNVSGVGTFASGAITSSAAVQAAAGSGFVSGASGPKIGLSGTGSPEGVVTAPVGSTWTDTNATTGAVKWIKASGSGNTGWVVEYGDTGWRGVTTWDSAGVTTGLALAAGATPMSGNAGGIYVRRTNTTVWVRIHNLTTSGSTSPKIYTAGWNTSGFTMQGTYSVRPIAKFDGSAAAVGTSYSSAYFQGYGVGDPYNWQYMETSWQTPDAWPTSLPGAAASI